MGIFLCCLALRSNLWRYKKPLAVNIGCVLFVILYSIIGGLIFLHFEKPYAEYAQQKLIKTKTDCVKAIIKNYPLNNETYLAELITEYCILQDAKDYRTIWSFKNAFLFGFGIITTLGYGLIEPMTINGRVFTVIYGFIGIPITVIMLTNFGRYLQNLEMSITRLLCKRKTRKNSNFLTGNEDNDSIDDLEQISLTLLLITVGLYLALGAICIPYFNGEFDLVNGIYYAYLCLTAIEFGNLIPSENDHFIPVIIFYMCVGLVISTIAIDLGSLYVRKLYYIGRKVRHMANVKIWFGSKELRVKELISALSQNIGLEPAVFNRINLDQLVTDAIHVREGRLSRVPQTHMIVEGIWPPELVPLFIKDGYFPGYVDEDVESSYSSSIKKDISRQSSLKILSRQSSKKEPFSRRNSSLMSMSGSAIRRSSRAPSVGSKKGEKLTVRFEDVTYNNENQIDFEAASIQHINPIDADNHDKSSVTSEISFSAILSPSD